MFDVWGFGFDVSGLRYWVLVLDFNCRRMEPQTSNFKQIHGVKENELFI